MEGLFSLNCLFLDSQNQTDRETDTLMSCRCKWALVPVIIKVKHSCRNSAIQIPHVIYSSWQQDERASLVRDEPEGIFLYCNKEAKEGAASAH